MCSSVVQPITGSNYRLLGREGVEKRNCFSANVEYVAVESAGSGDCILVRPTSADRQLFSTLLQSLKVTL